MARETRRGGGREARRGQRGAPKFEALPSLARRIPVYEVLDEEGLEMIHRASLDVLEQVGCEFRDPVALAAWRGAPGVEVEGERVRIGRETLLSLVEKAPEQFTLYGRNPDRLAVIGKDSMTFAPNYGSPFVRMADGQRRYGEMADLEAFHKLAHLSPALHVTGSVTCEPVDVPVPKRHLHITRSAIKHSDKPFMGAVTAPERAVDTVRMCEIAFGGAEAIREQPRVISLFNCNSPLVWDETMLGGMRAYAEAGQASVIAPFVMAGANSPASAVASVAQLNAEALAGIAYVQLVSPGAPVVYGHFISTVSMKSGAPMLGMPELGLMNFMIGQLARKYQVPWRSSGMVTGSKICDAQAAYESAFNMLPIMLAGANFILHSAGWSEAGLVANLAKFMLDHEQIAMLYRQAEGPRFADFEDALAAIREVGPGGHFLGTAHTQAHFQSAFFMPDLADNNSFEQWELDGGKDAATRGAEAALRALEAYQAPVMDPSIAEAVDAFVARREAELPDALE